MSEFDTPNFHEYTYRKKAVGKNRVIRILLVALYCLFVLAFFLFCAQTRFLSIFALCPVFTWMLIFFTWRTVSYDIYYTIDGGMIELGKVKVRKTGRKKAPKLKVHIKEATEIKPYLGENDELAGASRVYDFSESPISDKRIILKTNKDGKEICALFEGTARAAKLLSSLCPNASEIKGKEFHG